MTETAYPVLCQVQDTSHSKVSESPGAHPSLKDEESKIHMSQSPKNFKFISSPDVWAQVQCSLYPQPC